MSFDQKFVGDPVKVALDVHMMQFDVSIVLVEFSCIV